MFKHLTWLSCLKNELLKEEGKSFWLLDWECYICNYVIYVTVKTWSFVLNVSCLLITLAMNFLKSFRWSDINTTILSGSPAQPELAKNSFGTWKIKDQCSCCLWIPVMNFQFNCSAPHIVISCVDEQTYAHNVNCRTESKPKFHLTRWGRNS